MPQTVLVLVQLVLHWDLHQQALDLVLWVHLVVLMGVHQEDHMSVHPVALLTVLLVALLGDPLEVLPQDPPIPPTLATSLQQILMGADSAVTPTAEDPLSKAMLT